MDHDANASPAGTLRTAGAAWIVGIGLAVAACGATSTPDRPAVAQDTTAVTNAVVVPTLITTPTTGAPSRPGRSVLPDVTVDNVAGGTTNLATLAPSPRPILLWFWAPT